MVKREIQDPAADADRPPRKRSKARVYDWASWKKQPRCTPNFDPATNPAIGCNAAFTPKRPPDDGTDIRKCEIERRIKRENDQCRSESTTPPRRALSGLVHRAQSSTGTPGVTDLAQSIGASSSPGTQSFGKYLDRKDNSTPIREPATFLSLPFELRIQIFDYLFDACPKPTRPDHCDLEAGSKITDQVCNLMLTHSRVQEDIRNLLQKRQYAEKMVVRSSGGIFSFFDQLVRCPDAICSHSRFRVSITPITPGSPWQKVNEASNQDRTREFIAYNCSHSARLEERPRSGKLVSASLRRQRSKSARRRKKHEQSQAVMVCAKCGLEECHWEATSSSPRSGGETSGSDCDDGTAPSIPPSSRLATNKRPRPLTRPISLKGCIRDLDFLGWCREDGFWRHRSKLDASCYNSIPELRRLCYILSQSHSDLSLVQRGWVERLQYLELRALGKDFQSRQRRLADKSMEASEREPAWSRWKRSFWGPR